MIGKVRAGQVPKTEADRKALDVLRNGLGMPTTAPLEPRASREPSYPKPHPATQPPQEASAVPDEGEGPEDGEPGVQAPSKPRTGHPEWFVMPPNGIPPVVKPGTPVAYVRMHARLTADPSRGERQCMLSLLRVKDQDQAHQRMRGVSDPMKAAAEYTKGCIRVIDGHLADWGTPLTPPAGVDIFWEEIGPAYRQRLTEWYLATHQMRQEDRLDFFTNCIDDRVAG
jgi:hypothetical protein